MLAVAMLVCAGCSQSEPEFNGGGSDQVVGVYGWDPAGWYSNEIWTGQLIVEPSGCVYLDVSSRSGVGSNATSAPLRSFLRLPEIATRYISAPHYISAENSITVGDSPSMSSGDHVTVLGVQGWLQGPNQRADELEVFGPLGATLDDPEACRAHVSFWVSWMGPSDSNVPALFLDKPPIAGMRSADDAYLSNANLDWGVVEISGRCLYLWVPDDRIALDRRESDGIFFVLDGIDVDDETPIPLRRSFMRLGQPEVQFDTETQLLKVREGAALKTGDLIEIGGVTADGRYMGLDHYIEECHASSVIAPSSVELCSPEPEYRSGLCGIFSASTALVTLNSKQSDTANQPTTITEDFYVEQYGVTLSQARARLARIPQLQELLDEILDIELQRLAGLAIDHYDKFGAWVWLTGNDAPHQGTIEIAAANPDLEIRLGADHTYFELRDAQDIIFDIAGISGITHEPGGLDWLIHFVDVDMRANSIEVGIDPGHETESPRIPVDPDRPKASNEEVRAAIKTVEDALKGRVPVAYSVTDGRKAAQLAKRRPENNTATLDQAYYDHQRQQQRN